MCLLWDIPPFAFPRREDSLEPVRGRDYRPLSAKISQTQRWLSAAVDPARRPAAQDVTHQHSLHTRCFSDGIKKERTLIPFAQEILCVWLDAVCTVSKCYIIHHFNPGLSIVAPFEPLLPVTLSKITPTREIVWINFKWEGVADFFPAFKKEF